MSNAELRDAVVESLRAHRADCPLGDECDEHINLAAYLSHCAGVTVSRLLDFAKRLAFYEGHCPGCAEKN